LYANDAPRILWNRETGIVAQHRDFLFTMITMFDSWKTSNNAASCCKRGLARQAKGDLDGAIADYNRAIELDPKVPYVYDYRGFARRDKGDLDGAIADYNTAIELDPHDANGYHNRALSKQTKGDWDGALADFDRAIELVPSEPHACNNRGLVKQAKGDWDGALLDFNRAVELEPKDAHAYYNRAFIKRTKGNLDGALADYDKAIEFNPQDTNVYYDRGVACYDKRDWSEALSDFRKAAVSKPPVSKLKTVEDYSRIGIWMVRAKLGERDAATSELKQYLLARTIGKPGDWPSTIIRSLTGDVSEKDFWEAADTGNEKQTRNQRCEACFYVGTLRLIDGDKSAAADYFTKCLETGVNGLYEYQSAAAELAILKQ
jgi:tetratricopeptide (TPR) repeat protein